MPRSRPEQDTPSIRRTGPRLCSRCGEEPAGPGRVLCGGCKKRIEAWCWPVVGDGRAA